MPRLQSAAPRGRRSVTISPLMLPFLALNLPMPAPPDGTQLWWYVTALSLGVIIIGIAKAGFGGGIGILAVPLVANALPADRAIAFMLPILILADIFSNLHHRKQKGRSWPHLRWLLAGAVVGIGVGTLILAWLDDVGSLNVALNAVVGSLCLILVAMQCWRLVGWHLPRIPPGPWGGRATGLVAGTVSTLAHSAGPITSIYLLEQRFDKRHFTGTILLFYLVGNIAKLPTYLGLGLIDVHTMVESIWFLPLVPVGTLLGFWMHHRVPEKPFTVVIYLGTAAAAARMLYMAVTA